MKKKNLKKLIFIIIILFISIGFAVLTSNLSLNANLSFKENSFELHFENITVLDSSTVTNSSVSITDSTIVNFSGDFNKPGDYIDFSFYIVNGGTIDGQLNTITTNLTTEQMEYIDYSFIYAIDNSNVNLNDYFYAGQSRKVIAHFEYKEDIDNFINLESFDLTLNMKFIQPQTVTTTVWNYEYSGTEQYFIVPKSGTYKLEVWGAQGGVSNYAIGGYGGYSRGDILLSKGNKLFLNIGGSGKNSNNIFEKEVLYGGYNGGGNSLSTVNDMRTGAGGSTHISTISGVLSSLSEEKGNLKDDLYYVSSKIIIVSGGGGGSAYHVYKYVRNGGSGGGYIGNMGEGIPEGSSYYDQGKGHGGTQLVGGKSATGLLDGTFGSGCSYGEKNASGGGGGFFGGGCGYNTASSGGGGSGYIGNPNLTNKIMYCYNCQESTSEEDETNIKTRTTTNVSEQPISNYAKIGNGFARITFVG